MKKVILNILRVIISLGLIYYLVHIANINKIIYAFQEISAFPIILAVIAFIISMVFLAIRWLLLVQSYGIRADFISLFVYYFIGLFFNNFLPTSIGGDLSRAYYLGQHSGKKAASLGTVFLERVIGLLSTLSLAGLSLFWLVGYFNSRRIVYLTLFLGVILIVFMLFVMSRRLYRRLNKLISLITFYDIGDKISKVFDTLHYYRDKKMILISAYFFSLFAQFMLIVMNYILARGLGLDSVAFGYFFLLVPVTFLFSLFPSINGIGVRDSGYVLLLTMQGLLPAQILSLSFLVTVIPIVMSIVGGAFLLFYRHKGLKTPILTEEKI